MDKNRQPNKRVSLAGMLIDRTSAVPLHLQIAAHIRSSILHGIFPAGTQFLGSREVARELGCSRRQGLVFGYGRLRIEDASPLLARIAACIGSSSRNTSFDPGVVAKSARTIERS